jgi:hypothetical protein
MNRWTTAHFNDLSWHDNRVHSITIREGEHGSGEFTLDIDFILQWLYAPDGTCRFHVAPATLTFHDMSHLKIALDYDTPGAGICPFSIAGIDRFVHVYPNGLHSFRWHIKVNWPQGELGFLASGFTQHLRRPPIETAGQYLSSKERQHPVRA